MANNLLDFLAGRLLLETRQSRYNGKLEVWRDLAWGPHIVAGNITQSGGVAHKVWQSTFKHLKKGGLSIENCLILGLGGGSIANIVNKYWPNAEITGVEIDPDIVILGKKYLGLDDKKVKIILGDAWDFVNKTQNKYGLVCVDIYVGTEVPQQFSTEEFTGKVKKLVDKGGIAVFNRTYYGEKRKEALAFEKVLKKVGFKIDRFYPEANLMFICKAV